MGIDPGLAHCGWGVIALPSGGSKALRLLGCGEIRTLGERPLAVRLQDIYRELRQISEQYRPLACAVEELYLNKNSSSALPVAHARGVALLCAAEQDVAVLEFSANRIKQAVSGNGKARKQQVQEMVSFLLGLSEGAAPPSHHAADALAAAICLVHQRGAEALQNAAGPELPAEPWRLEKEATKAAALSARTSECYFPKAKGIGSPGKQAAANFDRLAAQALAAQDAPSHQQNVPVHLLGK